eukprot:7606243-Alexandrium_andersonii.AAC.1
MSEPVWMGHKKQADLKPRSCSAPQCLGQGSAAASDIPALLSGMGESVSEGGGRWRRIGESRSLTLAVGQGRTSQLDESILGVMPSLPHGQDNK